MTSGQGFLLVTTAASTFMAGVLWTMQVLNYPLLRLVGRDSFATYETAHNRRFAWVVVPGVLAAIVGAIGLLVARPEALPLWTPIVQLLLLIVVVASTAALQGRQHGRLASGFDERTINELVTSNGIRVVAWSASSVLSLWMCHLLFTA
jgi:hypothetical protein